ncbi:MAG: hypothetical protein HYR67_05250 [Bacteroidetes bacterium]|nr:hypothetical protein [Bacteroidota bacterium]
MKRPVALSLLLIFGLNILGYYWVFMGARIQVAHKIRESFDANNYQRGSEITFKVPLTLPYGTDMKDYERVDGEFNYHGEVYRLVKQKLVSDTLLIVCVKDTQAKKIDKALEDYVKTFADNPSTQKNHSKSISAFSKDYFSTTIAIEKKQLGWEFFIQWPEIQLQTLSSIQDPVIQPPRA